MHRHRSHRPLAFAIVALIVGCVAAAADTAPPGDGAPVEIAVGVFLVDLVRVDVADQSIEADFVILLSWHDPRLAHDSAEPRPVAPGAIWVPQLLPVQGRRFLSVVWEAASVDSTGRVTLRRRFAGPLSTPLDLRAFPFDRHVIPLSFAAPGASASDIRFVVDPARVGQARSLTVADWDVGSCRAVVAPYEIPEVGVALPGFTYEIPVVRRSGFYVWGVLSPLIVIIAMSWAVFWLNPSYVGQKVGIATTSILTLIAYRFALGAQLPKLSYLTRMDYFTLGATILIFLAFVKVVIEAGLVHAKREALAAGIDRTCRWAFPAALLALLVGSFWV